MGLAVYVELVGPGCLIKDVKGGRVARVSVALPVHPDSRLRNRVHPSKTLCAPEARVPLGAIVARSTAFIQLTQPAATLYGTKNHPHSHRKQATVGYASDHTVPGRANHAQWAGP
jgi:hypothetical protein